MRYYLGLIGVIIVGLALGFALYMVATRAHGEDNTVKQTQQQQPFVQQTKPGEAPLKDQNDDPNSVYVTPVQITTPCFKSSEIPKFIKSGNLTPFFLSKTASRSYLMFINSETKIWVMMAVPEKEPETACIIGMGQGYQTSNGVNALKK